MLTQESYTVQKLSFEASTFKVSIVEIEDKIDYMTEAPIAG